MESGQPAGLLFGSRAALGGRTIRRVSQVFIGQGGFEGLLARETAAAARPDRERGPGWVLAGAPMPGMGDAMPVQSEDWCFAHCALFDVVEVKTGSVNGLAVGVAERFFATARDERFDKPWPFVVGTAPGCDGLGRRASAVEGALREVLQRRMARVAKLASAAAAPRQGRARGLFLHFVDFDRVFVARDAWLGGQRRMADDPAAPSRSYLKVEEAYGVLGCEPAEGESVVDLGAAPGGWSYSAARRGARVIAIDNGPLKGGALGHPQIEHRREDAFRFHPAGGEVFDWLFCDLVEEPHHVMRSIVEPWIAGRCCRRFVANLKFGRADAVALLAEVRARLGPRCARLLVRHLFHDREELTLMGSTAG